MLRLPLIVDEGRQQVPLILVRPDVLVVVLADDQRDGPVGRRALIAVVHKELPRVNVDARRQRLLDQRLALRQLARTSAVVVRLVRVVVVKVRLVQHERDGVRVRLARKERRRRRRVRPRDVRRRRRGRRARRRRRGGRLGRRRRRRRRRRGRRRRGRRHVRRRERWHGRVGRCRRWRSLVALRVAPGVPHGERDGDGQHGEEGAQARGGYARHQLAARRPIPLVLGHLVVLELLKEFCAGGAHRARDGADHAARRRGRRRRRGGPERIESKFSHVYATRTNTPFPFLYTCTVTQMQTAAWAYGRPKARLMSGTDRSFVFFRILCSGECNAKSTSVSC